LPSRITPIFQQIFFTRELALEFDIWIWPSVRRIEQRRFSGPRPCDRYAFSRRLQLWPNVALRTFTDASPFRVRHLTLLRISFTLWFPFELNISSRLSP
jgi:hypothetical protein